MKCAALIAAVLLVLPLSAQTFTQQVQQHRSGQGTVTIHHDADIDRLVNGTAAGTLATTAPKPAATATAAKPAATATAPKPAATATAAKPAATATAPKPAATMTATKPKSEKSKAESAKTEKPKAEKPKTEKPKAEKSKAKPQSDTTKTKPQPDTVRHQSSTPARPDGSTQGSEPVSSLPATGDGPTTADSTALPSAPRHGYKTTGYRVQAFAGGNTRNDRQKAERTGNAMRQLLPGEDVYVRFYSPRWVCRVGNYRTYEEAHEKMLLIRKLGYESATIVKGKIIVYYD